MADDAENLRRDVAQRNDATENTEVRAGAWHPVDGAGFLILSSRETALVEYV